MEQSRAADLIERTEVANVRARIESGECVAVEADCDGLGVPGLVPLLELTEDDFGTLVRLHSLIKSKVAGMTGWGGVGDTTGRLRAYGYFEAPHESLEDVSSLARRRRLAVFPPPLRWRAEGHDAAVGGAVKADSVQMARKVASAKLVRHTFEGLPDFGAEFEKRAAFVASAVGTHAREPHHKTCHAYAKGRTGCRMQRPAGHGQDLAIIGDLCRCHTQPVRLYVITSLLPEHPSSNT